MDTDKGLYCCFFGTVDKGMYAGFWPSRDYSRKLNLWAIFILPYELKRIFLGVIRSMLKSG